MRSVLTTKSEVHARFVSLLEKYQQTHDCIEGLSQGIKEYIKVIDEQLEKGEDFDEDYVKSLLGSLNSEQTQLVNALKHMNELHAKMGYLV